MFAELKTFYPIGTGFQVLVHFVKELEALLFGHAADERALFNEVPYPMLGFVAKLVIVGGEGVEGVKRNVGVIKSAHAYINAICAQHHFAVIKQEVFFALADFLAARFSALFKVMRHFCHFLNYFNRILFILEHAALEIKLKLLGGGKNGFIRPDFNRGNFFILLRAG